MDYYFIGDPELLIAFRFVGIRGTAVFKAEDARTAFLKITQGNDEAGQGPSTAASCRILILTEEAADWLGELLIEWQLSGRYPLVVELPGSLGRLEGRKTLEDTIREAVGVRV